MMMMMIMTMMMIIIMTMMMMMIMTMIIIIGLLSTKRSAKRNAKRRFCVHLCDIPAEDVQDVGFFLQLLARSREATALEILNVIGHPDHAKWEPLRKCIAGVTFVAAWWLKGRGV